MIARHYPRSSFFVVAALLSVVFASPAFAQDAEQDEPERNWSNGTELSYVVSKGNADVSALGLRNVYEYKWSASSFYWESGWTRASSGDDRFAVGTEDDFEIITPPVELDNNRLFSKIRYQRDFNPRLYWYGSWDSARDEPSNINRQFVLSGGIGNNWVQTDDLTFRTNYGVAYIVEDLDLEGENDFAGYRLFYRLSAQLVESTRVDSELTFDGSFEVGNDIRTDWYNSVTVSMTDTVALKAGLRLLYRNIPALEDIDLEREDGLVIGEIIIAKQKLDTTFSTSLVINF